MRNAILILLFWSLAALAVVGADRHIAATSPLSIAVKLCAIGVAAAACVRLCETEYPIEDALMVGAAWLALSTLSEILETSGSARGWFELLGSPSTPMVRNVLLLAWAMGPALVALMVRPARRDSVPAKPLGTDALLRRVEGGAATDGNAAFTPPSEMQAPSELDLRA